MARTSPLLSGRDLPSRGKTLRCKLNCILSLSETRISATGLRKKMDGPIKSGHDGKRAENQEKSSWHGLTGPSISQQFHRQRFLPDSSGTSRGMTIFLLCFLPFSSWPDVVLFTHSHEFGPSTWNRCLNISERVSTARNTR